MPKQNSGRLLALERLARSRSGDLFNDSDPSGESMVRHHVHVSGAFSPFPVGTTAVIVFVFFAGAVAIPGMFAAS